MEEAVPTKSQKATISQDILPVFATVSTLSISAISHLAVTAVIRVTTVHVLIIAVIMDSFDTGTIGTDRGCLGTMNTGVTPPPSLDIAAIRLKKWNKTRTV
jgi:hypothetical protein